MTPLGAQIRKLRTLQKVSLKQHAAEVGVTAAYLSALEHGHRGVPTNDMLERIVSALKLQENEKRHLQDLVELSRPKVTLDTSGLDPIATEVANRFAQSITRMSEADLQWMLYFLHQWDPDQADTENKARHNEIAERGAAE